MDITPLVPQGRQIVHAYGNGGFKISGQVFQGSVLVCLDQTFPLAITSIDQLVWEDIAAMVSRSPQVEILLVGTGKNFQPISKELQENARKHGIAVDLMDTGAACRTYTVLATEERRVAAVLIAIP